MFLDARAKRMRYFRYSLDDLYAGDKKFELTIGGSSFCIDEIKLNLEQGGDRIAARISFKDTYPWPVKLLSPGVMGWYAFVPGMECYHGILSMDHAIEGFVEADGVRIDLTGGRGYIEKDWGASMPSSWIWMQTNHFDREGISLSGSIAKIPWLGNYFTGYIFGFLYDKKLYEFTTYSGAKVTWLDVTDDYIKIRLENKVCRLDIDADRSEGVDLPAPRLGEMTAKVNESLRSSINVKLLRKNGHGTELIYSGTGRNAGLEFVGDVAELIKGLKK
jgi:tocopherol cyclase